MAKNVFSNLKPIEKIFPGWDTLSPDEQHFVKANTELQFYKKNEIIYSEKDCPKFLMILAQGKAKSYKEGVGSRRQIVRMLKDGEAFAYRAILANEPYNTTVAAFEPSAVYQIKGEIFLSILRNNNFFCYRFLEDLATFLGESNSRTVNLTQKHIRGRLAESLIFLKKNYGLEEDKATINIYLSREDLASLSNMTTSNAIRTLSSFANEGIIAMDGRKLKIIDEEKLLKISKMG